MPTIGAKECSSDFLMGLVEITQKATSFTSEQSLFRPSASSAVSSILPSFSPSLPGGRCSETWSVFKPRPWICVMTIPVRPWMIPWTPITTITPMTRPVTVRNERSLLAQIAARAMRRFSQSTRLPPATGNEPKRGPDHQDPGRTVDSVPVVR